MGAARAVLCATVATLAGASPAHAWLLHEHARLTEVGIERLRGDDAATLRRAWSAVRAGIPGLPLDREVGAALVAPECAAAPCAPGGEPGRVGFGALPALAGDHGCTPAQLSHDLMTARWLPGVLDEARRVAGALASDGSSAERIDEWHLHHLALRAEDRAYRSRAAASSAHFQLPRHGGEDLGAYLRRVFGDEVNGMSLLAAYHLAALDIAAHVHRACPGLQPACLEGEAANLWNMLLAEAFALHFLQDAFSAGHLVGSFGGDPERMGTHDHYCQHGLEVEPWSGGARHFAHGDAFLAHDDLVRGGRVVAHALAQLTHTLAQGAPAPGVPLPRHGASATIDVCRAGPSPRGLAGAAGAQALHLLAGRLPRPEPASPSPPRFRNEVGPFVAASVGAGFGGLPFDLRAAPPVPVDERWGALAHARVGLGIAVEGVTSSGMDAFASLELTLESQLGYGAGRALGLGLTLHLPWAYVPFDGLVFLPLAALDLVHRPALQAFAGGPFGLGRPRAVLPGLRLQISAFRRFSVLHYPDYQPSPQGPLGRWRVVLPLVSALFAHHFGQVMSSWIVADLALDYSHVRGAEDGLGGLLLFTLTTRHFLQ